MNLVPGLYKHYKGNYYFVFKVAHHSETREAVVVYQCLYGDFSWWVRPLSMFSESIQFDNKNSARFEFVRAMTLVEAAQFAHSNQQ